MKGLLNRIEYALLSPSWAWIAAAGLLWPYTSLALDPQKAITQFAHRAWGVSDGIYQVYSIAQTSDGYLWVATANGLFRFDGVAFKAWEPKPGDPSLPGIPWLLLATKNGDLWVGGVGNVTLMRSGHSKVFVLRNPEERARVLALCEGKDGTIWAGTSLGLYRFTGENWQKLGKEEGLPDGRVSAVMLDANNCLWIATDDGRRDSGSFVAFLPRGEKRFQIGSERAEIISKMAPAQDGRIWTAQTGRSVRSFTHDQKTITFIAPEIRVGSQSLLFDRNGGMWIATLGDGLRRVRNTSLLGSEDIGQSNDALDKFTQKDGLSSDFIICGFEDREGVIWFGTSAGLDCFAETKITALSVREGLPFDQNLSVAGMPDGTIWAGSTPQGFMQIKASSKQYLNRAWLDLQSSGGSFLVHCLYADPVGDLYLGTGLGVAVLGKKDGRATIVPGVPDMKTVLAITRDPAGGLWLCDRYMGVYRLLDGKIEHFPEMHREADGWVQVAHTDPEGRVWLGFTTGEVAIYEKGQFRLFSSKDGLFPGQVTTVLSDGKGQTWVLGKGGISRYKNGRFQTVNRENGLPFDDIFTGLQDEGGFFWLAGAPGIFRVAESELVSAMSGSTDRVKGELFELSDGLRGVVRHVPYGARGDGYTAASKGMDGTLWFATTAGLAVIDPHTILRNKLPPPLSIQAVIAGGKTYSVPGELRLPLGARDCEIDYAALSFANIRGVRYRYKLDGYDQNWIEAGTRRQAFYSNLRPKNYTFHVSACNADEVWNEDGATVGFVVPPLFYETTWFYVVCGVVAIAGLFGAYTWRIRQLKSRQAELQKSRDLLEAANTSLKKEIEERTRAEYRLRCSEAYLTEAQRLSKTGSFGWNRATGEVAWSEETFCILQYDRVVKPSIDLALKRVHPDDIAFVKHTIDQAGEETDTDFEHRLLMPDGRIKQVRVMARASRESAAEIEFVGAIMDITDLKHSQEALRAAKARFEGILEIAEDAIISVDVAHRIVLFNQGAEKVFGYAASEAMGQPLDLLLPERFARTHGEHLEVFTRSAEVSRSMGRRNELFGRRKDGSEFPAEASISKLDQGGEVIFTVILRDITERQRLENQLRESEKNLAEGQRLTKTGSWILDFKTGNTDWSVETCRIFGFPDPPPSPHYREFRARVHPEDREAVDRGLRESFETGEPRPLKYLFILPNGVSKHIETISQPVRDKTGGVVRLMGTVMDVTERKQAEDAIRASEKWARGQAEALTRTLDALAREASSDRIVEHVLRTITAQLDAHSCSVWLRDESSGLISFEFTLEDDSFKLKSDATLPAIRPASNIEDVWPLPEVFRTGRPYVLEDIRKGPNFPWRAHVLAQGVVSILIVPMLIAGKVEGVIGIRFTQPRAFRSEEMELAQALAHQAMLAIQLSRLSAQSRQSAVMAERNRMARDIHDTLAQGFTGIIMQLEAAKGVNSEDNVTTSADRIERACELARESLQEARRSVRALRPRALRGGKLSLALDDMLKRMTSGIELNAEFKAEGDEEGIPADWEEVLLRITQESLTNTVKHAKARNFRASLSVSPDKIQLQLVDDGVGFNPETDHEGFGLVGMKERVDQMGGLFTIRSTPGVGTEILVVLKNPLLKNENANGQA